MDEGLLSLIILLLFVMLMYTLFCVVNYIGYKKRQDKLISQKLDQIVELLTKNN
ncbi:DUF4083 family protein [Bacillus sp. FJAT-28004]|uniref:DUF4083 family protein n=1 Tax=Bacillus sp. FJAT-28004 TaxID=1679165 RepID=UPI000AD9D049|nr:DUF4083 family protein [Bacillus sp. FJAT-28004]